MCEDKKIIFVAWPSAMSIDALCESEHRLESSDKYRALASSPMTSGYNNLNTVGVDLQLMSECDAVCFLDGWEADKNCRILENAATEYNLEVYYGTGSCF